MRPACAASSQGDAARRGKRRIPERSGRERTGTGHGTERASPTYERSYETTDGANAIATVRKRGATVMQGIIEARSERKNRPEGNFEGEQSPGRVGQRTSSNDVRWYRPASGAKPRGTTSLRHGNNGESGNGVIGTAQVEGNEKSEGAMATETWTGCRWGESSGGYELRCGKPRIRVTSKERCQQ